MALVARYTSSQWEMAIVGHLGFRNPGTDQVSSRWNIT